MGTTRDAVPPGGIMRHRTAVLPGMPRVLSM